jgi:hypothetical protein
MKVVRVINNVHAVEFFGIFLGRIKAYKQRPDVIIVNSKTINRLFLKKSEICHTKE